MAIIMSKRLAAQEAARTTAPVRGTPQEAQDAARLYEASLYEPEDPDPRVEAYWSNASLHQLAADYDAMLRGALAPWL